MEAAFLNLNYSPVHLLSTMYQEASVTENYYLSPVNVLRCDVSPFLRTELSKIINVPFADCGFLKTSPLTTYPMHVDALRIAAINMSMFEDIPEFKSFMIIERKLESIKYQTNYFTMLNVMIPHGVKNENTEKERIILSIGFKNNSYTHLLKIFKEGTLINDTL
jgi:hypothetical protein